jgi:hypothetical protein
MRQFFTKQTHLEWELQQVNYWWEQTEIPYYLEAVAESNLQGKMFYDLLACASQKKDIIKKMQDIKQTFLNSHL